MLYLPSREARRFATNPGTAQVFIVNANMAVHDPHMKNRKEIQKKHIKYEKCAPRWG